MTKINNNWTKFHIFDLFEIDSGTKLDKCKMSTNKPEINFVGRSNKNNGITDKVNLIPEIKPFNAGYLTLALGGEYLGSCFVQPDKFYTSQNVVVLIPKSKMTFGVKHFIATSIFIESQNNYSAFIKELNAFIKTTFTFELPSEDGKTPDWDYMENYMKQIESKAQKRLETILNNDFTPIKIDTTKWKLINVKDIFITFKKAGKLQVPTGSYVEKKFLNENGSTPRITVTNQNNGIFAYYDCELKNGYNVYDNFISVSFLGSVFYQSQNASLDMKVHCLKPNEITLNKYIAEFLITAIKASLRNSSYADQITSKELPYLKIMLPVKQDGSPDWDYMEQYMKQIESKAQKRLDEIQNFVNLN